MLTSAFCIWFFSGASFSVLGLLIVMPFAVLGLIYYFGEPYPLKWAYRLIIIVPLIITLVISIPQGIKVSNRINDLSDDGLKIMETEQNIWRLPSVEEAVLGLELRL